MGDGQQAVVYAVHPDTKKPYKWVSEKSLADIHHKDLPVITVDQAMQLVEYFESIIPDNWEIVNKGKSASNVPLEERTMMNIKPKLNISTTRLRKTLESLNFDEYDAWRTVGMGLYHQYGGEAEGFELWNEWSSKSEKYQADLMESKWSTFDSELLMQEPVTARTILRMARIADEQNQVDQIERFIEQYVYIEKGDLVADLTKPQHYCIVNEHAVLTHFGSVTALSYPIIHCLLGSKLDAH